MTPKFKRITWSLWAIGIYAAFILFLIFPFQNFAPSGTSAELYKNPEEMIDLEEYLKVLQDVSWATYGLV